MEYRTKAAVKIIASLTKKEAFELFNLIGVIEKKFEKSRTNVQSLDRETAVTYVNDSIDEWIQAGELEVPSHLNDSLRNFLNLMVNERAQLHELVFEYNCALCPLLQYDLFKANVATNNTFNVTNATNSIIGTQSDIVELGKLGIVICLQ